MVLTIRVKSRERSVPALSAVLVLCLSLSCGRKADNRIVAEVGRSKITLAEFKAQYTRYLLRPDRFDSPEMRRKFLESMVQHRLLALEGKRLGFDDDPWIRRFVESYGRKLARDAYVGKHVTGKVPPTDPEEVESVFGWLQQERRVRHLFAPTRQAADSLRRLLDQGRSFESIARGTFRDAAVAARAGDLGWVRWDQMDIDLANAVFSQAAGKVSEPVRSRFGWHIVSVEDVRGTPLLSEMDFGRAESRVRGLIEAAKREKAMDEWVKGFMPGLGIRVDPDVFPEVVSVLAGRLRRDRTAVLPDQAQITRQDWQTFMDPLARLADRPVAWAGGKPLTVSEFIDGLFWVPYSVTVTNPLDALGCVIRDRHITGLAESAGMNRGPDVRMNKRLAEESLTDERFRATLIDSIRVTDAEIDAWFASHRDRFPGMRSVEDIRPRLRNELHALKRSTTVPEKVAELRKRTRVEMHPEILEGDLGWGGK